VDAAAAATNRLAEDPDVEYAEPNYSQRLHWVPMTPYYSDQWNLQALTWSAHGTSTVGARVTWLLCGALISGLAFQE